MIQVGSSEGGVMKDSTKKSLRKAMTRIQQEFEENPVMVIGAAGGVLMGVAKLIEAISSARSKRAYAKQVDYRTKHPDYSRRR